MRRIMVPGVVGGVLIALMSASNSFALRFEVGPDIAENPVKHVNGFVGKIPPRPVRSSDPCAKSVGRFEDDVFGSGTGSVAYNPRIVITAAHIVVHKNGNVRNRVPFELPGSDGRFLPHMGTVVAVGTRRPLILENTSKDWAIVILDEAPAGVVPFPIINATPQEVLGEGNSFFSINFSRFEKLPGSGDQYAVVSEYCGGTEYNYKWKTLTHNCHEMPGGSGSALLSRQHGWCSVVAIHSGPNSGKSIENAPQRPETENRAVLVAEFRNEIHKIVDEYIHKYHYSPAEIRSLMVPN